MCGIAGAVWTDSTAAIDQAVARQMLRAIQHRGPDDEGIFTETAPAIPPRNGHVGVLLGHRRLSIIDLAGGHQPMTNEDGTLHLVFNGEIYNFRDLRQRLEGSGHRFATHCDTETILHLYEDEGLDFVQHLNGMFALALWDATRQRLVLARDRLGKKPLVYRHTASGLLFASELKSLLQAPGVPRELDPQALDDYLTWQYVPHPRTIFRGICKLPPGHIAVWSAGQLQVSRYWQIDFNRETDRPLADTIEEVRSLVTSSAQLRLESDVPLGAFLSGGVDSTLITGIAAGLRREPLDTFSISFGESQFDESRFARLAANKFGTRHHEFCVEPNAIEILPQLVWHYDEPFGDSSALPTWYVSQLARQQVTVALTGDGGDELFGGYERYQAVQLAGWFDRLPASLRAAAAAKLWQRLGQGRPQKSWLRKWSRFAEVLSQTPERRYAAWMCIFDTARRANLYSDDFMASLPNCDPYEFLDAAFAKASLRDMGSRVMLTDLQTYLPCDLLNKVDIASMAFGLECRQPLLDFRLVEQAAQIPSRYKLRGRGGKWILKQAFTDVLPPEIRHRRKMGFGVPVENWFRGQLREYARELLLSERALARGYFRPDALRQLLEEHASGKFNHGHRLWALVVLETWCRVWVDGE
jgi:asparagine synthase (glutamine-hydrolysing)